MSNLTVDSLRCFYDPVEMDETVYKFSFYPGDPDAEFARIGQYIEELKAFYGEVALHREAVLTLLD